MMTSGRPTSRVKTAGLFGKMACILMVFALVSFTVRLNWRGIRSEGSFGIISDAPSLAFYLALSSLICALVWVVLAFGFRAPATKMGEVERRP
jgi:hypothetical protein